MTNTFFISAFKITRKIKNKDVSWLNIGIETEISSKLNSDIVLPECKDFSLLIWIEQNKFFIKKNGVATVIADGKTLKNQENTSLQLPTEVFFHNISLKIEHLIFTPEQNPENLKILIKNNSFKGFLKFQHSDEITFLSLPVEGKLLAGKNLDNHIVLRHPGLSGNHMCMNFSEKGILVTDLNSKNGIFCGKKQIKSNFLWNGKERLTAGNTEISIFFHH